MCLSKVYLRSENGDELIVEEAASVAVKEGYVEVSTLFGEEKKIESCVIDEANLMDNYIILKKVK
ncbi:MAG: CooT family nickel-binding protein [Promethearchaeota archaeon]